MLDHFVQRGASVPATKREREPRARRGEGLESECGQDSGGAGVPRIRNDERPISMERLEDGCLALLSSHGHATLPFPVCRAPCSARTQHVPLRVETLCRSTDATL